MSPGEDLSRWLSVRELLGNRRFAFGPQMQRDFVEHPDNALRNMTFYKFAAKLIGADRQVLDVGCGEGLGTWLLAKECGRAKGIDRDGEAVAIARANVEGTSVGFEPVDFFDFPAQTFDAVVASDIQALAGERWLAEAFWCKVVQCLGHDGIAIVGLVGDGMPAAGNPPDQRMSPRVPDGTDLRQVMNRSFTHVFMFGGRGPHVHPGFDPVAPYAIAVGCRKRSS